MGFPFLPAIATGTGLLGTLFGGGTRTEIPRELQELLPVLRQRATEGFGADTQGLLSQNLNRRVGNEFGALGAITESRIARQGGGAAAQNVAANRLNTSRLGAIGEGVTNIGLANEQSKTEALRLLAGLTPQIGNFQQQRGLGFAQLFGTGLQGLFQSNLFSDDKQPINANILANANRAFNTPLSLFGRL